MSANGILENIEEVLMELTSFEKKFTRDGLVEIPQILDDYLVFVARTGNTHFPWIKIKPLFRSKLEKVIREFSQKSDEIPPTPNVDPFQFDVVRDTVFEQLEFFAGIPFTVQRLCELLTAPSKHYKRTDKFMRALEKNMLVVSTIEAVHPSSSISNSSLGGISNGSFSSTLEQREREAHLVNGANNPSLALASDDDDEKDCYKSDETEVYSPPQSNGNSQTEEQQQHMNGNTPDLETSGPCDSGESSSSENSSPNPHFSESASDSTTNEAVSAMQSSESDHHLKDELTDELLPLTDSMDIDSECSSSDNLLIETVTSGIRREEIQDEVQSTDEEERPCKKMKVDDEDNSDDSSKDEETSPSSSKDDEIRVDDNSSTTPDATTPSAMESCSVDDSSRVSTSQDKQESGSDDSSPQCSATNNEATPSTTSTPSPSVADKAVVVDSNDTNSEEEGVQEESSSSTTTTTTATSLSPNDN